MSFSWSAHRKINFFFISVRAFVSLQRRKNKFRVEKRRQFFVPKKYRSGLKEMCFFLSLRLFFCCEYSFYFSLFLFNVYKTSVLSRFVFFFSVVALHCVHFATFISFFVSSIRFSSSSCWAKIANQMTTTEKIHERNLFTRNYFTISSDGTFPFANFIPSSLFILISKWRKNKTNSRKSWRQKTPKKLCGKFTRKTK